jgi:membrane protein YqaA with SNARE-associated domain
MAYWLCIGFVLAFGLAVFPFGSIEVFLIGLAANRPDIPWLALGVAVATGQVLGKLVHFYAARGALRIPALIRPGAVANPVPGRQGWRTRLTATMASATERARRNPVWLHVVFAVSALVGLPPFGATTVLAGLVGVRPSVFLVLGLVGRIVRYSSLAAAPGLLTNVLF